MQFEFIELKAQTEIDSAELRARAREFPGREIDLRYLVRKAGDEVAFLWYDVFPTEVYLVLYELFVARAFRRQGIGSELIQHAEALAIERGYKQILVRPEPLSDEMTREQLIAWYERLGFTKMAGERGIYVKNVSTGES
jgi:ribosomal protein S18 acetylase RimI-like enzyme